MAVRDCQFIHVPEDYMKALFTCAMLSLFLSVPADIIPIGAHYISQQALIENLDTLNGAVCTYQLCSYCQPQYCSTPITLKADSLFGVSGQTNRNFCNILNIVFPPATDTVSISFPINGRLVMDPSPLIKEEYHFRLYYDWQGKICLGKVKLISTTNDGFPPDTQTFALPTAIEHAALQNAKQFVLLKCDPTGISFHLPRPQAASIQITDISGRVMKAMKTSGAAEGRLPFPKLAAGTYFVKLDAQDGTVSQQVAVPR
jgi:hypothetical protein